MKTRTVPGNKSAEVPRQSMGSSYVLSAASSAGQEHREAEPQTPFLWSTQRAPSPKPLQGFGDLRDHSRQATGQVCHCHSSWGKLFRCPLNIVHPARSVVARAGSYHLVLWCRFGPVWLNLHFFLPPVLPFEKREALYLFVSLLVPCFIRISLWSFRKQHCH